MRAKHQPNRLGYTVDLGILGEVDIVILYHYSPGTPDCWHMPNGDPGYPGDPAECEIVDIECAGLSPEFREKLVEILSDDADVETAIAEQEEPDYHEED